MYDERKEKFSFKSFFLTLLLVLLFVFLMLWLFPTKWDVNKLQSTYDIERLSVLYDEIFANNVSRMKDAAIGYFTNERMPQVVGESKKLTLQEMYDLHLVLKMKDKNGNACDTEKSYVEMTKYTEEYRLKVNLSCGDQEDYIIVYLGCYNYCSGGICEKRVPTPSNTTLKEENNTPSSPDKYYCKVINNKYYDANGNVVSKTEYDKSCKDPDPTPDKYYCKVVNDKYYDANGNVVSKVEYDKSCNTTPITKKYMYEYKLVTEDCTNCTKWSDWQTSAVTETDTVKVQTKTQKELVGYKTTTVQTGTKVETITKKVTEKYIKDYTTKLVVVGTKEIQVGQTTKEVTEKVAVGTVEKYVGTGSGTTIPEKTSTTRYEVIGSTTQSTCSNCAEQTIYTWKIWETETVYDVVTKTVEVPVYKTINIYEEQTVPLYDFRVVTKQEEVSTPIYEQINIPEYSNVTYYRYQTCTTEKGTTDIKWSYSKIDSDLIGKGYKLTGNVKEV